MWYVLNVKIIPAIIDANGFFVKCSASKNAPYPPKTKPDNQIIFHVRVLPNTFCKTAPIPVVNCAKFPEIETPLG